MLHKKVYMTCGECEGEGFKITHLPIARSEDANDYTDQEEAELCSGSCIGPHCETCHGNGKVAVLV